MKGKIDKEGTLYIQRGNKSKDQSCPFTPIFNGHVIKCADWCPLFGEPENKRIGTITFWNEYRQHERPEMAICLRLCHKTLVFDTFTDERVSDGKETDN